MEFLLVLPPRVRAGTPVPITLHAQNRTPQAIDLYLRGRVPMLDVIVENARGETVWQRLHDDIIPAILSIRTLGPGSSLEIPVTWDQRDSTGTVIETGIYTARGALLVEGEPIETPRVEFVVHK